MTTDAIRQAVAKAIFDQHKVLADAAVAAYEAAQAKAAAPADGEPDAEAFSVALDTLRNRLGGTIRPYEVEEFAKVLHAFAARRVAEAVTAERAQPDASESAAKIWYERIDKQPTVHGKIEELSAIIAEARRAERERCAQIIEEACGEGDSPLAEQAADAFNGGSMRRPAADRINDLAAVIAAAIRNPQ